MTKPTWKTRLVPFALAVGLALPPAARGQHVGDMLLGSTAAGVGALALAHDFATPVRVFESASGGGNVLYSATDPGWDALVSPGGGLFPLASGTAVGVQITAIDAGVSLKIGASTLNAVGQARALGTAPSIHVHPTWQLVLPAGTQGERRVSFVMTSTTAEYATSAVYTAIVSNTTTTTTSTPAPTTATSTLPGATTTTSSSSTTAPPASTTSTTSSLPPGTTTTTLASDDAPLAGASLALRARRRHLTLSVTSRDPAIGLAGDRGGPTDPTLHGATLRLSAAGVAATAHALPARNWRAVVKRGAHVGWVYADPQRAAGPVSRLAVRAGRVLGLAAAGAALGIDLAADPQPLGVVLETGSRRWCLAFGGTVRWKAGVSFVAREAPAPAACAP